LISVMKNHQKYFPVYSAKKDELLSNFVFVSGIKSKKPKTIIKGNERVIRARFSDAEFFYNEDSKNHLSEYLNELKSMVYLSQIGSYYQKVQRLKKISRFLAGELNLQNEKNDLVKAAELAKADLATQMVFEFPELQGTMGKYYAHISGEKNSVSTAIEEHYMPLTRDGDLPESMLGSILSIVEKIDNICSCFIADLKPTGSADPYALRRQAIGIIRIIIEQKLNISLNSVLSKSINITIKSMDKENLSKVSESESQILDNIINFISDRFKNLLIDEGFSTNVIDSVLSLSFDNPTDSYNKIKAVQKFKKEKQFEELAIAFKRVVNIAKDKPKAKMNIKLFQDKSETNLYNKFQEIKEKTEKYFDSNGISSESDYLKALNQIKSLKKPVDDFFDNVMVMDKDEKLKNNRLALLSEIKNLFFQISDFSKI
ncbi:MAG: glycine--tRNA ligase subunit beta, partial [Candidatus Dadabacteria bacterium]|nr:glycine--tRNA ligase subunit beta [Candidatus Dadabacteria bacterium]NIQ16775.1 glycine--tRNA ligase subunit beta [Candidatus Dadabacteria bacterium]